MRSRQKATAATTGGPGCPGGAVVRLFFTASLALAGCASGPLVAADPIKTPPTPSSSPGFFRGTWDSVVKPFAPGAPPPPAESISLRGDGLVTEKAPVPGTPQAVLAGAHDLFRQNDYARAENLYSRLSSNEANPPTIVEEARYYEGECLRLQGYYPRAADTYHDLLKRFERSRFKEQALQHMFDIANYWLDETREEMRQAREYREGKRWWINRQYVHIDRTRPLLDVEGRALEKLDQIRLHDIFGPLADKCLFLAGSVQFFRGNYREAEQEFSQIHEKHPKSPLAPQAVELAILSKHLSTGGSDYDGRKTAEARELVHAAYAAYPELASTKKDFLNKQLLLITFQQADQDLKKGQLYERLGHPGSAYFYYGVVKQRYPNTPYADKAVEAMARLKEKHEKELASTGGPPTPAATPGKPQASNPGTPGPSGQSKPPVDAEPAPAPRPLPSAGTTPPSAGNAKPPPRPVNPTLPAPKENP